MAASAEAVCAINETVRGNGMRRASTLEDRLVEWGKEYGGGRYGDIGGSGSPLASMMKWHGRAPTGLGHVPVWTAADDVQEAVMALAKQEQGWLPAQILRCEYLTPGQPMESKLQKLRRIGDNVGRVRYYQHLRTARIHVAGWLRIPFSPELDPIEMESEA
ncbi:hypothetical protein SAMN04487785_102404 [Dyella jiangningensis]|uniref:hypothetical protein n=1 Tax=Dyella sp. AtDHG13 TaxID=1938897 RepID=UPI0008868840|nr:hypothetical protein [Dyella sp. AtDHG13]PXV60676.1 hypothetical protein BDW41_102403 [Dyella sp. AtDHG13]SDJ54725.1 hypothetical protein SAMN04487785_102404 [Dyella jiangningensis]